VTSEEIPSITVSAISTSQTSHRSPLLGPPQESRYGHMALASLAPHQPRPAGDAAYAMEREAWSQVRVEFNRALALRSEIRRAGWFN